jgi:hypothetical protein
MLAMDCSASGTVGGGIGREPVLTTILLPVALRMLFLSRNDEYRNYITVLLHPIYLGFSINGKPG